MLTTGTEKACEHFDPVIPKPAYIFRAEEVRAFVCAECADPYLAQLWDPEHVHECVRCGSARGKPAIARMQVKPATIYVLWALCDPCMTKLLRIDRSRPATFR